MGAIRTMHECGVLLLVVALLLGVACGGDPGEDLHADGDAVSHLAQDAEGAPVTTPCLPAGVDPCVLTLHGEEPALSESCSDPAWAQLELTLPGRFEDLDENGWWEAVVRVDLDPRRGCRAVEFVVVHGDEPVNRSFHIGDSRTNDTYGGDEGTSGHCAEVYTVGPQIAVMSGLYGPSRFSGQASHARLFRMESVELASTTLAVRVQDQLVVFRWTRPDEPAPLTWSLGAPQPSLFSLSGAPDPVTPEDPSRVDDDVYAAFNRVIHDVRGAPSQGRFGRGAKKVEISLMP